ncbi:delta and Notch-like epidermal growth factor-related receptor [Anneissia japonica]|uniref:delta and Notch-like epidermal growth factor-related receptor n=1 Tax=Anneissia japonica TaxID=1529436 RepID=UPI001425ADC3|nr:delta and Notch-like epidermal growth factor-related receptor [Anneissia japonica]
MKVLLSAAILLTIVLAIDATAYYRNPCETGEHKCNQGHSKCKYLGYGKYECKCDSCYSGTFCKQFDDPCDDVTCQNEGTCSSNRDTCTATCSCRTCYTGQFCQTGKQSL